MVKAVAKEQEFWIFYWRRTKQMLLLSSEVLEVEEGRSETDLRRSNLSTLCQRRRGLPEEEEIKLEKYDERKRL